jgi:CRISPR-associated protein Cas5h
LFKNVQTIETDSWVSVHSAVVSGTINELNFEKVDTEATNSLEEELLPADFLENGNREVSKMTRVLYSTRNFSFEVKLSVPYYKLDAGETPQNILFIE